MIINANKRAIYVIVLTFIGLISTLFWYRQQTFEIVNFKPYMQYGKHNVSTQKSTVQPYTSSSPRITATGANIKDVNWNLFPANFSEDFPWFNGQNQFPIFCRSCGLVSSSGILLNTTAGKEINAHDCVLRMNNAPTQGFEDDVGTRTTYRIFSHTSVVDIKHFLIKTPKSTNSTQFLVWGPERNLKPGGITNAHLKAIVNNNPKIDVHMFSRKRIEKADALFEFETGKNRIKSGAYLSTGWFTLLFARNICEEIHVYGIVDDDYCTKFPPNVPYHYYKSGLSQCATYIMHENAKGGAHRFLTEKKVFKKWAKSWGNLHFHYPKWDLDVNNTSMH